MTGGGASPRRVYSRPAALDESGRCAAERHGDEWAYRRDGCRCPRAIEAARAKWRADKGYHRAANRTGRRRTYRPRPRDQFVDATVVQFVVEGAVMPLERLERIAVTAALTERGKSAREIAARIGVTPRTAQRYRAEARAAGAMRSIVEG
jgi:hypothetical protein